MVASTTEQILRALTALLATVPGAKVERNTALPETIPAGGLIIVRDGDPGEPDQALGGFAGAYYSHRVDVEVYVQNGDPADRDTAFDTLTQAIGAVLASDPGLGGLAFGMTYGRPSVDVEAVDGAAAIKTGTLEVALEYEAPAPLG